MFQSSLHAVSISPASYLKSITMLLQCASLFSFFVSVSLSVFMSVYCLLLFSNSLTYRLVNIILLLLGGQYNGYLPFWLPSFLDFIYYYLLFIARPAC